MNTHTYVSTKSWGSRASQRWKMKILFTPRIMVHCVPVFLEAQPWWVLLCWTVTSKKPESWKPVQDVLMLWSAQRDTTLKADLLRTPGFFLDLRCTKLGFSDYFMVAPIIMSVPQHLLVYITFTFKRKKPERPNWSLSYLVDTWQHAAFLSCVELCLTFQKAVYRLLLCVVCVCV